VGDLSNDADGATGIPHVGRSRKELVRIFVSLNFENDHQHWAGISVERICQTRVSSHTSELSNEFPGLWSIPACRLSWILRVPSV
jgi:hypothetical protein